MFASGQPVRECAGASISHFLSMQTLLSQCHYAYMHCHCTDKVTHKDIPQPCGSGKLSPPNAIQTKHAHHFRPVIDIFADICWVLGLFSIDFIISSSPAMTSIKGMLLFECQGGGESMSHNLVCFPNQN